MPWIIPLASAVYGGISAASASSKRHAAEKDLEAQANNFKPNASILDYYNKSLSNYTANPYQSKAYGQQNNQIQRNLATGLNAASNRRLGLGAVGGLVQQANDASGKAVANAEIQGGQDLARLGQASQMKTNEEQKKFDMLYNLKAAKAGAYAQTENTGIQNLYSGLSSAASLYQPKENPYKNDLNWGNSAYNQRTSFYNPQLLSYR